MPELSVSLIIGVVTALVGLLCVGLAAAALIRARKAPKVATGPQVETVADLKNFAGKQALSALIMFAFAVVIFTYS